MDFQFGSVPLCIQAFKCQEEIFLHIFNVTDKTDQVTLSLADYLTWTNQERIVVQDSVLRMGDKKSRGLKLDVLKILALLNIKPEMLELMDLVPSDSDYTSTCRDLKMKITMKNAHNTGRSN